MADALKHADEGIERVGNEWSLRKETVQADYERILRDLQKSRIDGEEFIRLRRQIEDLRPLQKRLHLLRKIGKEHTSNRRTLIAEWEDVKAAEYRSLVEAASKVTSLLKNRVEVEVLSSGNREPLFKLLRDEIGGRMSETINCLNRADHLSLTQLVETCRSGTDTLHEAYGITSNQAKRLVDCDADVLMQIEELELEPVTSIHLNIATSDARPIWKPLEELSTGQKATAVLLLLLLESNSPLIIDQPEDDLDNRFITEGIVPRMRKEKQRRQFIFTTHNANIPVLGDAELIIGLSAAGEAGSGRARISMEDIGSIDSPSVRACGRNA